jgi:hypothetical protein
MTTKRITDQEIENCGWTPSDVMIEKDWIDKIPDDAEVNGELVILKGWIITAVKGKQWYIMYRNSKRLTIVENWYNNEKLEWDMIFDYPVVTPEELLSEMSYLNIKK